MVVNRVLTCKVDNITKELCGTEFSKGTASKSCKNLDPIAEGWLNRDDGRRHEIPVESE